MADTPETPQSQRIERLGKKNFTRRGAHTLRSHLSCVSAGDDTIFSAIDGATDAHGR